MSPHHQVLRFEHRGKVRFLSVSLSLPASSSTSPILEACDRYRAHHNNAVCLASSASTSLLFFSKRKFPAASMYPMSRAEILVLETRCHQQRFDMLARCLWQIVWFYFHITFFRPQSVRASQRPSDSHDDFLSVRCLPFSNLLLSPNRTHLFTQLRHMNSSIDAFLGQDNSKCGVWCRRTCEVLLLHVVQ
jgi:hypothetical protein